jgi:hypothetical protein
LELKFQKKELFELTPLNAKFDAIYLCSALVLEEYRRKGITKQLCINAIENISKEHPLKATFVWAFSPEGDLAAENIARLAGLLCISGKNNDSRQILFISLVLKSN